MESTLSVTTTTIALFTVSKALNRKLSRTPLTQCLSTQLLTRSLRCISTNYQHYHHNPFASASSLRSLYAALPPIRRHLECVASSAASYASSGGGGGFGGESSGGGGGGGGESGSDGGDAKGNLVVGGAQEVSALSSDVIVLDVGV